MPIGNTKMHWWVQNIEPTWKPNSELDILFTEPVSAKNYDLQDYVDKISGWVGDGGTQDEPVTTIVGELLQKIGLSV